MNKRTKKRNLELAIVFAITAVLAVYSLMTIWVGVNLSLFSMEAVEYAEQYTEIQAARQAFYNSSNTYVRWLSNLSNNLVRIPLGLLIIASPALFIHIVRKYNMNKKRKARK